MNAPDKIYCGNNGNGNLSFSTTKVYDSMEEYIRKAALLKWANEKKAELLLDEELTDVAVGINMGMDMLIHKLNSL